MPVSWYHTIFQVFSFILGAAIGSFLNVCIYRMPRDLSVNEPKRSFCPNCKTQIKWYHNLPLVSWLWLRGKCGYCGVPISPRYLGVEFFTGCLFLAIFHRVPPVLLLPYWILASVLIVATFIDLEFYIIPNEITWGGVGVGVILSLILPRMMQADSHLKGLMWSVIGAATGYFLLWGVVEAGKLAFGKKAFALNGPTAFTWTRRTVPEEMGGGSDADLVVGDLGWKSAPRLSITAALVKQLGRLISILTFRKQPVEARGESWVWSDISFRDKDRLKLNAQKVSVDGESFDQANLVFHYEWLEIDDRRWDLNQVDVIKGEALALVIPQEAMGFGDVKFIAAIGAFLGWQAVLFTVPVAALCGSVIGVGTILIGKREWSAKIPFGPYLAVGALAWIFTGPEWVEWYSQLLVQP